MLREKLPEATSAYQYDQLWDGLTSGIESTVHRVQIIWDTKYTTEDWGFLLVDTKNDFNYINHIGMLWTVFHLWTSRARFVFNWYFCWLTLILKNGNRKSSLLHSRDILKQEGALDIFAYGIWVLPLFKQPKASHPDIIQPGYAIMRVH